MRSSWNKKSCERYWKTIPIPFYCLDIFRAESTEFLRQGKIEADVRKTDPLLEEEKEYIMEREIKFYAMIIDQAESQTRYSFFADADLDLNRAKITYIHHNVLSADVDNYDNELKKIFGVKPDYHFFVTSAALIKLVDQLGGIYVNGEKIPGEKALELVREGKIDAVVNGLSGALKNMKNLVLAIPNLLNSLKDTYQTDFPIKDIVKVVLSEVGDLKDWKADFSEIREN